MLVDTAIVAKAPVRLLVSGMGDALAAYFEGKAAADAGADNCAGGKCTMAALALAKLSLIENADLRWLESQNRHGKQRLHKKGCGKHHRG